MLEDPTASYSGCHRIELRPPEEPSYQYYSICSFPYYSTINGYVASSSNTTIDFQSSNCAVQLELVVDPSFCDASIHYEELARPCSARTTIVTPSCDALVARGVKGDAYTRISGEWVPMVWFSEI
jgi:hypothetical protein